LIGFDFVKYLKRNRTLERQKKGKRKGALEQGKKALGLL